MMISSSYKRVFSLIICIMMICSCFFFQAPAMAAKSVKVKSVTVTPKKTSVLVGKTVKLAVKVLPANASNKTVTWKTSDKKIATVSKTGVVTGKKAGKVTVTATSKSGNKKGTATVEVKKVVKTTSVKFNPSKGTLSIGEKAKLSYTVSPKGATNKSVTWSSSNTKVAKVSKTGEITALRAGTAKITAKTNDTKKKATYTLTVKDSTPQDEDAPVIIDVSEPEPTPEMKGTYRAFLIGQEKYYGQGNALSGPKRDVQGFRAALLAGGYKSATAYYDQTGQQIKDILGKMSTSGIKKDDVTVFFYSGHGADSNDKDWRGALMGVDGHTISVNTVRYYLDKVPGTVILILDSCLSGQHIYSKSAKALTFADAQAVNQAIIDAFSEPVEKGIGDDQSPATSKYKVLTACAPTELSYTSGSGLSAYSVFSRFLSMGCGYDINNGKTSLYADANWDTVVTIKEAYAYTKAEVDAWFKKTTKHQTTQVWPANDAFILLGR